MAKTQLLEMTSAELHAAASGGATVIVPVASTEILGHHGPLGGDVFVADEVSRRLAAQIGGVAAPTIPVGDASDMMSWPGTLTIRPDVLAAFYEDVCRSLAHHGFRRIVFLTAHLGNLAAVAACGKAMRRRGVLVAQIDWWRAAARAAPDLLTTKQDPTGHGGELITSVLMALRPDLVDLALARDSEPEPALRRHLPHTVISGGPFYTYPGFQDFTASGAWGDLTYASAEKGAAILDRAIPFMADFILSMQQEPLPDPLPDPLADSLTDPLADPLADPPEPGPPTP